jgi:hypothetical protein
MIGGIANCPDCGRITQVGGLRDPLWRGWQLLSLGVIVGLAVVAHFAAGPLAAAVAIAVGGVVAWLVSRAL